MNEPQNPATHGAERARIESEREFIRLMVDIIGDYRRLYLISTFAYRLMSRSEKGRLFLSSIQSEDDVITQDTENK